MTPGVFWHRVARSLPLLSALLVLSLTTHTAEIIDPSEALSEYTQGRRLLREGDWWSAAQIFERLSGRYPESEDLDLFIFFRAKAYYHFGDNDAAIAGFSAFLSQFPQSPAAAHATYFVADAYYRSARPQRALEHYLEAYRLSADDRLNGLLLESISSMFEQADALQFSPDAFEELGERKRCRLIDRIETHLAAHGQERLARKLTASCREKPVDTLSDGRLGDMRGTGFEVALVLPLSGELRQFGEDLYNGAAVASALIQSEHGKQIQLTPYDTKGDPVDAARLVGELAQSRVKSVIGPLTSEEAAVAAARSHNTDLPILIPAATQAGLTQLSESAFQLSPNIELEGTRSAEYAVTTLQADSAAVITSTSADHLRIADAFVERFKQLGGTVVAVQYYRPRDKDFGAYIRDIKTTLLGEISDSTFYIDSRGDTIDVDALPAHVDCLFLPGEGEQIRLLLPQIRFYNLNGAYIGSDGWGDEVVYKLGDHITKKAVFPSPFLAVSKSPLYTKFATSYDARYGRPPGRLASLGFDALTLVAQARLHGAREKAEIADYLKGINGFEGTSGAISFGAFRENTEIPFFRITNGQAIPIVESDDDLDSGTTGAEEL